MNPNDLRRWTVRLPALAQLAASALGAAGGVSERVPGRAWKLGTVRAGGRAWVGTLLIGLDRPDAAAVVTGVPELRAANALAFVPSRLPAASVWPAGRAPATVGLCDVLALAPEGLTADRQALTGALTPVTQPVAKGAVRTFSTPPGTIWERVSLAVGEHDVLVTVGGVAERFGFAEAGFEDRREVGKPDEVWAVLRALARFGGQLGTEDAGTTKPGSLKQKVSVLRERLRALLALDGDPFHRTSKGQPYRARFAIRAEGNATFPTPPGATWDDISLTEVAGGLVEVAVAAEGRGTEHVPSDEGAARWEATTTNTTRTFRYAIADLGLTEPAGCGLVAVLRAGGRLTRPADDPDLIALGGALTTFFQLTGPPFAFDPKRRLWTAQFEAASLVPPSDR